MQNFNSLASRCSCADLFDSYLVGNCEDRVSRGADDSHILRAIIRHTVEVL